MKTIAEINSRIRRKQAVVLTASEAKKMAAESSVKDVARQVDVVTTATFSPMCSSGMFLNVGHTRPAMKMQKATLDGVPAYGGLAAVDLYLGATEENPENQRFGGAHVIEKLVKGETVNLTASGRASDCYPGNKISADINLEQVNQAYLFNPRNCYQNYNAAVNSSSDRKYTYMGVLAPDLGSINYSSTGEISPLFNDPELRTIGVGSRIFFCGGSGYIAWEGTQFNNFQERDPETGAPIGPAATLAIIGDLRQASPEYLRALFIPGYGISLYIGIGIPIPILDEDLARNVCVRNHQLKTRIIDYATGQVMGQVNYEDLIGNNVRLNGARMPARTFTNHAKSRRIMALLKKQLQDGEFILSQPQQSLPVHGKLKGFTQ